jgi:hypothetical protein
MDHGVLARWSVGICNDLQARSAIFAARFWLPTAHQVLEELAISWV